MKVIFVIPLLLGLTPKLWATVSPVNISFASEISQQQESLQESEEREKFYSNFEPVVNLESQDQADEREPASQGPTRRIQSIQKNQNTAD